MYWLRPLGYFMLHLRRPFSGSQTAPRCTAFLDVSSLIFGVAYKHRRLFCRSWSSGSFAGVSVGARGMLVGYAVLSVSGPIDLPTWERMIYRRWELDEGRLAPSKSGRPGPPWDLMAGRITATCSSCAI